LSLRQDQAREGIEQKICSGDNLTPEQRTNLDTSPQTITKKRAEFNRPAVEDCKVLPRHKLPRLIELSIGYVTRTTSVKLIVRNAHVCSKLMTRAIREPLLATHPEAETRPSRKTTIVFTVIVVCLLRFIAGCPEPFSFPT
jgi:hypothetical protein